MKRKNTFTAPLDFQSVDIASHDFSEVAGREMFVIQMNSDFDLASLDNTKLKFDDGVYKVIESSMESPNSKETVQSTSKDSNSKRKKSKMSKNKGHVILRIKQSGPSSGLYCLQSESSLKEISKNPLISIESQPDSKEITKELLLSNSVKSIKRIQPELKRRV